MNPKKISDFSEVEVGSVWVYGGPKITPEYLYQVDCLHDTDPYPRNDQLMIKSLETGSRERPFSYMRRNLLNEFSLVFTATDMKFKHLQRILHQLVNNGDMLSIQEMLLELEI